MKSKLNWVGYFVMTGFALLVTVQACKPGASQSRVYFVSPKDGETVGSTLKIQFGVEGKTVRPAGQDVTEQTSGHHHLLIDNEKGFVDAGQIVPADNTHIHFGKGETETTVTLPKGKHKLSLQFADGAHISYGKEMSASIVVNVE